MNSTTAHWVPQHEGRWRKTEGGTEENKENGLDPQAREKTDVIGLRITRSLPRIVFASGWMAEFKFASPSHLSSDPFIWRIHLEELWMPGIFNLDHLQPIKQLLSPNVYIFFTLILGGQFLLPQRANIGKRAISQLQNWMRQRVSSAWGIQTGPFAAH